MAKIDRHFSRDVVGLTATASCREAAHLMAQRRIGAVAVRDGNQIVGLVTERDLVGRLVAKSGSSDLPIKEVVRHDVPRVTANATEMECANLMRDHHTRHLLVAEGNAVVGVISMRDVIALMLDEKQFLIEQLQSYIYQR